VVGARCYHTRYWCATENAKHQGAAALLLWLRVGNTSGNEWGKSSLGGAGGQLIPTPSSALRSSALHHMGDQTWVALLRVVLSQKWDCTKQSGLKLNNVTTTEALLCPKYFCPISVALD